MSASGPSDDTPAAATASVEVGASAAATYALVTDLAVLTDLAEEAQAMTWRQGSDAAVGAVFTGTNRNGWRRWSTRCTVTDAAPGERFAFEVTVPLMGPLGGIKVSRWQYDVEPLGSDRCRVTESTWDRRPGWFKRPAQLATGVGDRTGANQSHIEATLDRLKARAES